MLKYGASRSYLLSILTTIRNVFERSQHVSKLRVLININTYQCVLIFLIRSNKKLNSAKEERVKHVCSSTIASF